MTGDGFGYVIVDAYRTADGTIVGPETDRLKWQQRIQTALIEGDLIECDERNYTEIRKMIEDLGAEEGEEEFAEDNIMRLDRTFKYIPK